MPQKRTETAQNDKITVQRCKSIVWGKNEVNKQKLRYELFIGIDTGVNTGLAIWNVLEKKLTCVRSVMIHQAIEIVKEQNEIFSIKVIVEDARLRTWFGKNAKGKEQGAGSIKRDAKIWEDFLTDQKIPFEMVHPLKGATKMNAEVFKQITKYEGVTNEHSRDASMLVINRNY